MSGATSSGSPFPVMLDNLAGRLASPTDPLAPANIAEAWRNLDMSGFQTTRRDPLGSLNPIVLFPAHDRPMHNKGLAHALGRCAHPASRTNRLPISRRKGKSRYL